MKRPASIILCIGISICITALLIGLLGNPPPALANATAVQVDIAGPAGSGEFGKQVVALPNGNIVITDPSFDDGATQDVGAVYLYNGVNRTRISTLTGSSAGDQVGSGGVVVLENGNYVVLSPLWDHEGTLNIGAATWCNKVAGINGVVSDSNSLVGDTAEDQVGLEVVALPNNHYVVLSPYWDSDTNTNVGAVTWGNGSSGVTGVVSPGNSLIGSQDNDMVGNGYSDVYSHVPGARSLINGNYLVHSSDWDNVSVVDAGAVTWRNGTTAATGVVSETNSLVGTATDDLIYITVRSLAVNGNYVIGTDSWDNMGTGATDAGAVIWAEGDGSPLVAGAITSANALVGETTEDWVSYPVGLDNGNYVVCSGWWDSATNMDAGAVTWASGTAGITGTISTANSLIGDKAGDQVCVSATALPGGDYVMISPYWDSPTKSNVGAVTWMDGTTATSGTFDGSDSMIGNTSEDLIGFTGIKVLANGNYVIGSRYWDNGLVVNAGAVTWVNGSGSVTGVVTAANSLVGSHSNDYIGWVVYALTNGNYVVSSPYWSGLVTSGGAVTFCNGASATSGVVGAVNSLVGSVGLDQVGLIVYPLKNGNYVTASRYVNIDGMTDAGAVTWGNGTAGVTGVVGRENSLVGTTALDTLADRSITVLDNGNYVFLSKDWHNGGIDHAGAVTWGDGTRKIQGEVSSDNSVLGTVASGGSMMVYDYDDTNAQLVVGRPAENLVTFFRPTYMSFLPIIKK